MKAHERRMPSPMGPCRCRAQPKSFARGSAGGPTHPFTRTRRPIGTRAEGVYGFNSASPRATTIARDPKYSNTDAKQPLAAPTPSRLRHLWLKAGPQRGRGRPTPSTLVAHASTRFALFPAQHKPSRTSSPILLMSHSLRRPSCPAILRGQRPRMPCSSELSGPANNTQTLGKSGEVFPRLL